MKLFHISLFVLLCVLTSAGYKTSGVKRHDLSHSFHQQTDNNEQLYALAMKDGNAAFARKDYKEARREYSLALHYKPGDAEALRKTKACDKELLQPSGGTPKPASQAATKPATPKSNFTETVKGISFNMIKVEGGSFEMGDVMGDNEEEDEKPIHRVTLSGYYMGETEVTQALWRAVMGSDPSFFENCDQCPVEQVSWEDVQEFLLKLNAMTGKRYRLPTEAEWEYAARERGRKVRFGNGKDVADPSEMNFCGLAKYKKPYSVVGVCRDETTPVKSFPPNGLGLYDMSGNVWEWCSDWYGDYPSTAQTNPQGPVTGSHRVCRGGSWYNNPQDTRVANRHGGTPTRRSDSLGFRLALPL